MISNLMPQGAPDAPVPYTVTEAGARAVSASPADPAWCTVRHYGTSGPLDVGHHGQLIDLVMPRTEGDPVLLAYARLTDDGTAPAHLFVENGLEGAKQSRREADAFVENLRAFADQVAAAAQHLPEEAAS
ncbi:hypothetical protein ABZ916_39305 [Streptomyces sp. NPDC046853]|uniref:DUF6907 domain-containing protein n=1 Tax=Streptomyces sp. NPDC046853 TaxID=3154920 RepID=UPI0033F13A65